MSETLAACLTPAGVGAIAVIGVRGPQALGAVEECFRARSERETAKRTDGAMAVGKLVLGRFGGDVQDEVVLVIKQIEPVPALELHCHGGREVVRMILEALASRGIRVCSWEEWERSRAESPARAEAAIQLAKAPTVRTASILLDQYHGAFERELSASGPAGLRALVDRIPLGRHLVEPWRVVAAGAANVGKSSLVNALAGYARSVVAPAPGTTRDLVRTRIALEGWPVELVDTAGLREAESGLEMAGMQLTQSALQSADLVLWVVDGSAAPVWPSTGIDILPVINKADLPPAWDFAAQPAAAIVSAQTGQGIAELGQSIARRLVPSPPPPGAGVPISAEQVRELLSRRNGSAG